MITRDQVKHVSLLAKLSFSEEELDKFTPEIQSIVQMVEELQVVDTEGIAPTFHGNTLSNVFRPDQAQTSDHVQAMLDNAPTRQEAFIKVPAILDEGEGA